MAKNDKDSLRGKPTQLTQPVKGEPIRIPIPKRKDVLRNLRKVAKPKKS